MNNQVSMYDQLLDAVPFDLQVKVKEIYLNMLTKQISVEEAKKQSIDLVGTSEPIERLLVCLDVPMEPIPSYEKDSDMAQKKVKNWTSYEDQRLIAGMMKYGISDWTKIGQFIGNGRCRLQCLQRWQRSLNPMINKNQWTPEEDIALIQTVQKFGVKKWTKVSSCLVGRTDVQCRYRYQLIQKKYPNNMVPETKNFIPEQIVSEKQEEKTAEKPQQSQDAVKKMVNEDYFTEFSNTTILVDLLANISTDPSSLFDIL